MTVASKAINARTGTPTDRCTKDEGPTQWLAKPWSNSSQTMRQRMWLDAGQPQWDALVSKKAWPGINEILTAFETCLCLEPITGPQEQRASLQRSFDRLVAHLSREPTLLAHVRPRLSIGKLWGHDEYAIVVDGDLIVQNGMDALDGPFLITGSLFISDSPSLRRISGRLDVRGDVIADRTGLRSLPDNTFIQGKLTLRDSRDLRDLPEDLVVQGSLDLRGTAVAFLSPVMRVLGRIIIDGENHELLSELREYEKMRPQADVFELDRHPFFDLDYGLDYVLEQAVRLLANVAWIQQTSESYDIELTLRSDVETIAALEMFARFGDALMERFTDQLTDDDRERTRTVLRDIHDLYGQAQDLTATSRTEGTPS